MAAELDLALLRSLRHEFSADCLELVDRELEPTRARARLLVADLGQESALLERLRSAVSVVRSADVDVDSQVRLTLDLLAASPLR